MIRNVLSDVVLMSGLMGVTTAFAATCDFTGDWKNGSETFQLTQSGELIRFTYHNANFNHSGSGAVGDADNSFAIRQTRTDKATKCKTTGTLVFVPESCDRMTVSATWDGLCGTPAEEGPWTVIRAD